VEGLIILRSIDLIFVPRQLTFDVMENMQQRLEISSILRYPKLSFFDLPTEIRHQIYSLILRVDYVIDFDPRNYRTIAPMLHVFLASKRFLEDCSSYFYSQNTLRLFPAHGRFFSDRQMPLIRCLSPDNRATIKHLELRLGPGWTRPPQSWRVNKQLGLKDLTSLKRLEVYIEIDPSSSVFKGFRTSKAFYTDFAGNLMKEVLVALPVLEEVQFDGYSGAALEDPLLARVIAETKIAGKEISFGKSWSHTLALG
jgi:hypothetical protein